MSLGSLGVVTRLTLDVEPAYAVASGSTRTSRPARSGSTSTNDADRRQRQWLHAARPRIEQVWVKRRAGRWRGSGPPPTLFGARPAIVERHPIRGLSPDAATPQLGVAGPWHERLPHFRLDHTQQRRGLQTEYFVGARTPWPRSTPSTAHDRIAPLLLVGEIRTIAADDLWLSPAFERPLGVSTSLEAGVAGGAGALPDIEAALEPFAPRPHWAKLFTMAPDVVRSRYERLPAFADLATAFDPEAVFSNAFVSAYVTG